MHVFEMHLEETHLHLPYKKKMARTQARKLKLASVLKQETQSDLEFKQRSIYAIFK